MRLCSAPLAYYCRQSVVTRNDGTGPVILKFRAGPQQNVRIDSNHRYQFSRRITPLPTPGGTCTMSKSSSIARPESSSAGGFCNTFTDSVAAAWFAMTVCRYASSVRPRASACASRLISVSGGSSSVIVIQAFSLAYQRKAFFDIPTSAVDACTKNGTIADGFGTQASARTFLPFRQRS
jgi:hypothetical protein